MIETHPFGNFIPSKPKYLILGSFTGRQAVKGTQETVDSYDWFYGTKRNQFWSILEGVYGIELNTKTDKQCLLSNLGIAMADIIYQCERKDGNNLDSNLTKIIYNEAAISEIIKNNDIKKTFFTSRFVELKYKLKFTQIIEDFPTIQLITLPSPSPRYALLSKDEKITKYKELLPKENSLRVSGKI